MSVTIHSGAILVGKEHITFGENVIIDSFVFIAASKEYPVHIGNYVHIAAFASIAGGPVTLEDFTNVGAGSRLVAGSDNFWDALIGPTIPAEYRKVDRRGILLNKHATLGANCVVLPGVEMAEGSAAGSQTLVNRDTQAWCLYVGSPMSLIKGRKRNMLKIQELEASLQKEHS